MYKIIGADGKEYGPITADQLRQWVAEGRVNAQTKILAEGATEWRLLTEFPEFAGAIPSAPPTLAMAPEAAGGPGSSPSASQQVAGPAIGLIVTAILGFLVQVVSLVINLAGASLVHSRQMPSDAFATMLSGTVGAITSIIGILVSGLILFGAIKLKRLESYGLAMTVSIIAMIPCVSPCCLIGLPLGIWAVVVLSKPEVKSAFH